MTRSRDTRIGVSPDVTVRLLLEKTDPVYPQIAKAARVSGTVVLDAVISQTGRVIGLRVMSGPPMLQQSAIDAVKTWRYRPYLWKGEPVKVDDVRSMSLFTLGGVDTTFEGSAVADTGFTRGRGAGEYGSDQFLRFLS
jgi:protein TonB